MIDPPPDPPARGASTVGRREFLAGGASICLGAGLPLAVHGATNLAMAKGKPASRADPKDDPPRFPTRGILLGSTDLDQPDWPEILAEAGLNVLGLHPMTVHEFAEYAASPKGSAVLARVRAKGIAVEFEHHVMNELLPRKHFAEAPEMFREDTRGKRTPKGNFCCSSEQALRTIREHAERLARLLPYRSGRYFFWPDDGAQWCRCRKCRGLSVSDQNLILANTVLEGVRRFDPKATACCLCYLQTLAVPRTVKPAKGIFLEFAPIRRSWEHPLNDRNCRINRKHVTWLEGLLEFFGTDGAQVLEYWLDASLFSRWKRPAKKLPDMTPCLQADMAYYAGCGFEAVTTFGCYLDPSYWKAYGPPPVKAYGRAARGA